MVARKPIFANKEDANAREALQLYEAKQYKKAMKLVEQNLKKNLSHAELLALKGCATHQLGHTADAEPYIVKALAKEPNNYLVNHLAGIYYRAVEKYPLAAKWYKAAVDHGLQNPAILRDLALLQSQVRDWKNLRDSRQRFLESQPGYRANWTAVAVAHHLNKDYDAAVSTLAKIEGIIAPHLQEQDRYEQSECVLYKNTVIADAGNFARALEELEKDLAEIRDRAAFREYKAKYLMMLGRKKEASLEYRALLQRNPDNASYYALLEACLDTASGPVERRLALYDRLGEFYPRADPPKFLPLAFLPADHAEFRPRVEAYVLTQLQRGVPATFVNVKPLYRNRAKRAVIASVVTEFLEKKVPQLAPPVFVWTHYFLLQHQLYLGHYDAAMSHVDSALAHLPTLVELYILKARVTKHMGDAAAAAAVMEEGRLLDLQDRFINSKATKYLMRANRVDDAITCILHFTKVDDGLPNGLKDLHVMQANWVLVESAEAYVRLCNAQTETVAQMQADGASESEIADAADLADIYRGLALKRYQAVVQVFGVFANDQFDFHSYCFRRGTPRDYMDMLRWEDRLHATPIYVRAIKGLTALYWEVLAQQGDSAGDAKGKKKKQKKKLNIKKKSELIARVESEKDDADPLGALMLANLRESSNVLADLAEHARVLTAEAANYRFSWELAYRVHMAEHKYVLALQALRTWAKVVDPHGRKLRIVATKVLEFLKALENDESANVAIVKVAQKGLANAFPELADGEDALLAAYSA